MMPGRGLPILTYHSLDGSGSVISVEPALFERQMADLAEHGFQSLTLTEAMPYLTSGEPPPDRSVVLTFDDGYENVYTQALPVLARYGFRATVFLIADHIGSREIHAAPGGLDVRLRFMSWAHVRELEAAGWELGAHTRTHPDLTSLALPDARSEIVESKEIVEEALGRSVETFAYPFGCYDDEVREIVCEQFAGAVSTRLGRARPGGDPYALRRVDSYYLAAFRVGAALAGSMLDPYLWLRRQIRTLRRVL